jgi:multiple sugar transport system permease protein
MQQRSVQGPVEQTPGLVTPTLASPPQRRTLGQWLDAVSGSMFIGPAVAVLLFFSLFPLIVSLYLSFSRLRFVRGGVEVNFVGFANYRKLLLGSDQAHFLGVLEGPPWWGWVILAATVGVNGYWLWRYLREPGRTVVGFVLRMAFALFLLGLVWLLVSTLNSVGRPGTLVVTLVYVYVGILFQYLIGLGLALLTAQPLPGRRFFRVVFLLPMMITPVGVAYLFRMLTDTSKGPFAPLFQAIGMGDFTWVTDPWGARAAVMIGDIWQWVPFMFIVLLAAVEGQAHEPVEAARVDGANSWQIFRYLTLPAILPVSSALILIRMIEAFKIVDLPNILTNGGPGTATESMTLHSFIAWRALDIGGSAAVAYLLLVLVTILSVAFVNLIRRRTTEVV